MKESWQEFLIGLAGCFVLGCVVAAVVAWLQTMTGG